ncbi:hypothetical protein D3C71_1820340 [compost metagenome]
MGRNAFPGQSLAQNDDPAVRIILLAGQGFLKAVAGLLQGNAYSRIHVPGFPPRGAAPAPAGTTELSGQGKLDGQPDLIVPCLVHRHAGYNGYIVHLAAVPAA